MTKSLPYAAVALVLAACAQPQQQRVEHGGEEPPSPELVERARHVRVLPDKHLGCASEALGLVDVHAKTSSSEQALDELRVEGARLGADAVVGVEFEHADGRAATHLSGMAVRCRDLLRGRPYDVIGIVDVPGDMGDEEQAFRRLKERARALRADLLLNVTFVHGEGTGPTLLRATAIRIRGDAP